MTENAPPTASTKLSSTIDYATPDADGLPAFIPEVEAAIDQGQSVRKFSKFFRRRPEVNKYIVKSFRRRFDLMEVAGDCVLCDRPTDGIAGVLWVFQGVASFTGFSLSDSELNVSVRTWHSFCEPCLVEWFGRVRWALLLRRVGAWLMLGSTLVILASSFIGRRNSWTANWFLYAYISLGVTGLVLGGIGALWFALRTPRRLSRLTPRWMKFRGIEDFTSRSLVIPEAISVDATPNS